MAIKKKVGTIKYTDIGYNAKKFTKIKLANKFIIQNNIKDYDIIILYNRRKGDFL